MPITSPNIDRFSKFSHCQTQYEICNKCKIPHHAVNVSLHYLVKYLCSKNCHVLHAAASRTASWKITIRRTQLQHSFYFISDEQMALRVLLWTAKRCVFHRADITAGSYNKRSLLTYGHMTASHESFSRIRQLTPTCTTHLIYGLLGQQVRHLPLNDIFIGSGALTVRPHQFLQHRLQNMWCV